MKDWRAIAIGNGLGIPSRDLDRIVAPLDALEEAFRPLVKELTAEMEPAVTFRPEEEGE